MLNHFFFYWWGVIFFVTPLLSAKKLIPNNSLIILKISYFSFKIIYANSWNKNEKNMAELYH